MLVVKKSAGAELVIRYGKERLVIQNLNAREIKLGIVGSTRFVVERKRSVFPQNGPSAT